MRQALRCRPGSSLGVDNPTASLGLHAPARPQLPVAPGQDKGGILWSWQSRGRCHQRPGSGTAPSPADLPSPLPCPQQPRQPPQCHIPSTRAGGCASFAPAPCHGATGLLLPPNQDGAGAAALFPNAHRDQPRGEQRKGLGFREGSQHPPPHPGSLSPCAAPGVTWESETSEGFSVRLLLSAGIRSLYLVTSSSE